MLPPVVSSTSPQSPVQASQPESGSMSSPPQNPTSSVSTSPPFSPHALSVAHSDTQSVPENPVASATTGSHRPAVSGWVIWSRKPANPSHAPGLIISPRAFPPEDVIQKALSLPTPPVTPKLESIGLNLQQFTPLVNSRHALAEVSEGSPEPANVPSSSATDTTPAHSTPLDTPVPGSPLSSATSVSNAPALSEKAVIIEVKTEVSTTTAEIEAPFDEKVDASSTVPTNSIAATAVEPAQTPSDETPVPATPVAPAAKPAPPKRSWASLLQPTDASASSSKSRLPVSSVVGFSIPADAPSVSSSSQAATASPHRNELLNLLSTGPATATIPLKIRPRGLVNTGNMCFANSVLQVLIYCPPFHRLFSELRKYLAGPVIGSQRDGNKATPLVDATIQFLKEFVPEPSPSSSTKSKGKEKQEDDFDELDSFIPTYVYDAMKEKKRFANMIVSCVRYIVRAAYSSFFLKSGWAPRGRRGVPWVLFGYSGRRVAFNLHFLDTIAWCAD